MPTRHALHLRAEPHAARSSHCWRSRPPVRALQDSLQPLLQGSSLGRSASPRSFGLAGCANPPSHDATSLPSFSSTISTSTALQQVVVPHIFSCLASKSRLLHGGQSTTPMEAAGIPCVVSCAQNSTPASQERPGPFLQMSQCRCMSRRAPRALYTHGHVLDSSWVILQSCLRQDEMVV